MRVQVTALLILLNLLTLVTGVYGYDKGLSQSALGDKPTLTISDAKVTINKELSLSPLNYNSKGFTEYTKDSTISYKSKSIEYRIYEKESGVYEYETVFYSKPLSNVIKFNLNYGDLKPIRRAPFTEYTFKNLDNPIITENKVFDKDSLIFFIDEEAIYQYLFNDNSGNVKYSITRPYILDAKGVKTWCRMDIVEGVLLITIPQIVIDKGVYPLILDPTIGNKDITLPYNFSFSISGVYDYILSVRIIPSEDGVMKSLGAYIITYDKFYVPAQRNCWVKMALYDEDKNLLGETNQGAYSPNSIYTEINLDLINDIDITKDEVYFIAIRGEVEYLDPNDYLFVKWNYVTGEGHQTFYQNNDYDRNANGGNGSSYPNPYTGSTLDNYKLGLWGDYDIPPPDEGGLSYSHLLLGSTLFLPFILLIVSEQLREQY